MILIVWVYMVLISLNYWRPYNIHTPSNIYTSGCCLLRYWILSGSDMILIIGCRTFLAWFWLLSASLFTGVSIIAEFNNELFININLIVAEVSNKLFAIIGLFISEVSNKSFIIIKTSYTLSSKSPSESDLLNCQNNALSITLLC